MVLKLHQGWGVPIILKGTDGEDGTNGNTLLSGMEEPTLDVGIIGDFYFSSWFGKYLWA